MATINCLVSFYFFEYIILFKNNSFKVCCLFIHHYITIKCMYFHPVHQTKEHHVFLGPDRIAKEQLQRQILDNNCKCQAWCSEAPGLRRHKRACVIALIPRHRHAYHTDALQTDSTWLRPWATDYHRRSRANKCVSPRKCGNQASILYVCVQVYPPLWGHLVI